MSTAALDVFLHGMPVGQLDRPTPERPRALVFRYGEDYLANGQAVALSHSLPLQPEPFADARARNWFAGLLPEAAARESVARNLRLDVLDDYALLAAIGGECAGAVELWLPGARPIPRELVPAPPIAPGQIEDWIRARPRAPLLAQAGVLRLSLAGAHDKMALVVEPDGTMRLPAGASPSTHLLKISSDEFPNLVIREALGLALARRAGLTVVDARLWFAPSPCLLVRRYDRVRRSDGLVERVHQEDLCQAMGLAPEAKYQDHGGPDAATCLRFLRDELRIGARGLDAFVHWLAFNVAIGNADAHAKNLSVLRALDGHVALAPLYDLVPTGLYPGLGRALAMNIGAATDIDLVVGADWEQFAERAGLQPRYARKRARETAAATLAVLDAAVAELQATGAPGALLQADRDALAPRLAAMAAEARLPEPPHAWRQRAP